MLPERRPPMTGGLSLHNHNKKSIENKEP